MSSRGTPSAPTGERMRRAHGREDRASDTRRIEYAERLPPTSQSRGSGAPGLRLVGADEKNVYQGRVRYHRGGELAPLQPPQKVLGHVGRDAQHQRRRARQSAECSREDFEHVPRPVDRPTDRGAAPSLRDRITEQRQPHRFATGSSRTLGCSRPVCIGIGKQLSVALGPISNHRR